MFLLTVFCHLYFCDCCIGKQLTGKRVLVVFVSEKSQKWLIVIL